MELQEYQDVWEYKQIKIGPFWFTKKVLKEKPEHRLAEQRANEMSELLPQLDEVVKPDLLLLALFSARICSRAPRTTSKIQECTYLIC